VSGDLENFSQQHALVPERAAVAAGVVADAR